jgi:hypothetical protein
MNEFEKHEGRLTKHNKEAARLELLIGGYVRSIRDLLDPLENPDRLRTDEVLVLATELVEKHSEYMATREKIQATKEFLGRA